MPGARWNLLVALSAGTTVSAQAPAPTSPTVRLSGYLQARETYENDVGLTGSINRARLSAGGAIVEGVTWRIQGEFRTGGSGNTRATVSLQDAFIRYAKGPWAVQAGQFKTPFTREFIISLADVETADRAAVVDTLAPKRDLGVMGEYTYRVLTTVVGIFGGDGQNTTVNRDSTLLGIARVVVRPIPVIALGANVGRYFGDSTRFGFDANYEGAVVTARAEFVAQTRDGIVGPMDQGWYAQAGAFVARPVQVVGKYEWFDRPAVAAARKQRVWTAALNLYPWTRNTRITVEYVSRKTGDPSDRRGLGLAQFQVRF